MILRNVGLSPNYTEFKPQKTVLLIVTSVKTSIPIKDKNCLPVKLSSFDFSENTVHKPSGLNRRHACSQFADQLDSIEMKSFYLWEWTMSQIGRSQSSKAGEIHLQKSRLKIKTISYDIHTATD
jgi:hypothetical protein